MPDGDESIRPEGPNEDPERKYPGITAFLNDPNKTLGEIVKYIVERGIKAEFVSIEFPPKKPNVKDNKG
jgi:hypothetical protein